MKNNHRFILCILAFVFIIFLTAVSSFADETPEASSDAGYSETEVMTYIKDRVVPTAIAVISALGALYIGVAPVVNKVRNASERLGRATDDVKASNINYKDSQKRIDECIARVEKLTKESDERWEKVREIMTVAFCNNDELVSKGFAKYIAEISADEGDKSGGKK